MSRSRDPDYIKAARRISGQAMQVKIHRGCSGNLPLFLLPYCLQRIARTSRGAVLDLNKHKIPPLRSDDIDLSAPAAKIHLTDLIALFYQKSGCNALLLASDSASVQSILLFRTQMASPICLSPLYPGHGCLRRFFQAQATYTAA